MGKHWAAYKERHTATPELRAAWRAKRTEAARRYRANRDADTRSDANRRKRLRKAARRLGITPDELQQQRIEHVIEHLRELGYSVTPPPDASP